MKAVEAPFAAYEEQQQEAAGHAHREAKQVGNSITFMPEQVAKRYFKMIAEHKPFLFGS
jgi:hypothetical protein